MENNSSPQRLNFIIRSLKTSGLGFSKAVGVSQPFIAAILKGRAKLSRALLEKINKTYPEVNTHWVLTGEGKAFFEPGGIGEIVEVLAKDPPTFPDILFLNDLDLRKTLAYNLDTLIITLNVKKKDLFAYLIEDVSKQAITTYFNGTSQMPLSALIRLETLTGIPIKELLTRQITSKDLENIKF